MKNIQLIIFDLDGTLIQNPEFYKKVYSQSLTELVKEMRGEKGLEVLSFYRKNYGGRGELALFTLNIPFSLWAKKLEDISLDLIEKNETLVSNVKNISAKKIIYTGSPVGLAKKILMKTGFSVNDFYEIIGWQSPEEFPLKWTGSSFIFRSLIEKYQLNSQKLLSIGDTYATDIYPAKQLKIPTILIDNISINKILERLIL